jgi:hypothetical protein
MAVPETRPDGQGAAAGPSERRYEPPAIHILGPFQGVTGSVSGGGELGPGFTPDFKKA